MSLSNSKADSKLIQRLKTLSKKRNGTSYNSPGNVSAQELELVIRTATELKRTVVASLGVNCCSHSLGSNSSRTAVCDPIWIRNALNVSVRKSTGPRAPSLLLNDVDGPLPICVFGGHGNAMQRRQRRLHLFIVNRAWDGPQAHIPADFCSWTSHSRGLGQSPRLLPHQRAPASRCAPNTRFFDTANRVLSSGLGCGQVIDAKSAVEVHHQRFRSH